MKKISTIFILLAILLSNVMCAVVAYNFSQMQRGAEYGHSAPAWVAFLYAIPYGIGIGACILVALVLRKRMKQG